MLCAGGRGGAAAGALPADVEDRHGSVDRWTEPPARVLLAGGTITGEVVEGMRRAGAAEPARDPPQTDQADPPDGARDPAGPTATHRWPAGDLGYARGVGRLVTRWLGLLVLVVVLETAFVRLGRWRLRRLDERPDDEVVTHEPQPPRPCQGVSPAVTVTDAEHRLQVRCCSDAGRVRAEAAAADATGTGDVSPGR